MASAAIFFFVVVVPIWSAATILTRWIETWAEAEGGEEAVGSLIESVDEMTARIAALEKVLAENRATVEGGVR
jgi:Phage shock protein B